MELAGKYDLTIEQGVGFALPLDFTADGNAVDLTGSTARMQIRERTGSPTVLISLTTENDRITLGGTAGTVTLSLSATETAALSFKSAVYDLEIAPPTGEPYRLLEGSVFLDREVTRG